MANYKEAGIGTTCAVGSFPMDESPYSLKDMAGNVNEWTRTRWGFDYPYELDDKREDLGSRDRRVIRGGAYNDNEKWPRCAYRDWLDPYVRISYSSGFRVVVVSPFFTSGL